MLTGSVGGIPIAILGSPYGHDFLNSAGAYNPGTFTLSPEGVKGEDGRLIDPLLTQYSYSLVGSAERGAPVLGLWVNDMRSFSRCFHDPESRRSFMRHRTAINAAHGV